MVTTPSIRHFRSALHRLLVLWIPILAAPALAHGDPADFDLNRFFSGEEWVTDQHIFDPVYRDQPIQAIDMHMHSGRFENMGPLGQQFVLDAIPLPLPEDLKRALAGTIAALTRDPYTPFVGIKNECRRAGVVAAVLFAVYTPEAWGIEDNETVIDYLDDARNRYLGVPYFYGFASLNQTDWETREADELSRLRQALTHPKMVGIKLAFAHNVEPLDNPAFDSIYRVAAEFDAPVYHHIGSSPLRSFEDFEDDAARERYYRSFYPSFVEGTLRRFPQVRFILGHMGYDFNDEDVDGIDEVFRLARQYPNAYLEISALGTESHDPDGSQMDRILATAKQSGLIDRVIYGSDGPGFPGATQKYLERTLASMERVGYSYEEARAVLSGNFLAVTKLNRRTDFKLAPARMRAPQNDRQPREEAAAN
ncbi:Amidohydrolase [Sulfidibacter corallicola]|uniref:Amidohydrolase n=1 Tax=Sulfidibacter corallicola TaxID=2818388 RepID=A0A8A4TS79_SULCO|nr:amidohydrolase family protein [Sulfidibacter corallicola]QTD52400.1 amidohydrolase [Sulfidibacter corallicola]